MAASESVPLGWSDELILEAIAFQEVTLPHIMPPIDVYVDGQLGWPVVEVNEGGNLTDGDRVIYVRPPTGEPFMGERSPDDGPTEWLQVVCRCGKRFGELREELTSGNPVITSADALSQAVHDLRHHQDLNCSQA